MSSGFRTDNDVLAQRAGAFTELSVRADRIADDLTGQLSSYGECWGSDEPGRAFAGCHVEQVTAALQVIEALPGELLEIGSRLSETAAAYAESEASSDHAVRGAGYRLS
jgi:hypothetical protein